MPIGESPPATLPVDWLPLFRESVEQLAAVEAPLKQHNIRFLLALLNRWNDLPGLTAIDGVQLGTLTDHAYRYYTKRPSHRLAGGNETWLKLFGGFETRRKGANDWRVAVNSQRGFGCFATIAELSSATFKVEPRSGCEHRTAPAGGTPAMNIGCALSPASSAGTHTPCYDVRQAVALSPKLLRQTSNGNYQYRTASLAREDLQLLVGPTDPEKVPILPLLVALYGGSDQLNVDGRRRGVADFLSDHHFPAAWLPDLTSSDPSNPHNQAILEMTESRLLVRLHDYMTAHGLVLERDEVINFYLSLKPRSFIIISGISGTGKSWIARLFAAAIRRAEEKEGDNFKLISVGSNWRDKTYLFGFYNHLTRDFEQGPMFQTIEGADQATDARPFICLLDETNLSPIEYYFGDFLSVMETRVRVNGQYVTDELIFAPNEHRPIPDNLFVIGTVNVDESTHGLSRKVLDRANTIEFDEVDLKEIPSGAKTLSNGELSTLGDHLRDRRFRDIQAVNDVYPAKLNEWNGLLINANEILVKKRKHFGARVRDEIIIYMAYAWELLQDAQVSGTELEPFTEIRALDYQFMQKVIPRIVGTREELQDLLVEFGAFVESNGLELTKARLDRMATQEIVSPWTA